MTHSVYFYPLQHGLLKVLFILLSTPLQVSWYLEEICYWIFRSKLIGRLFESESKIWLEKESYVLIDLESDTNIVLVMQCCITHQVRSQRCNSHDTVTQVYSNGTIRIRRGSVEETINIQNVTPYFTWMHVLYLSVPCVEENVIKRPFVRIDTRYECTCLSISEQIWWSK
jgi:hypothetical protein